MLNSAGKKMEEDDEELAQVCDDTHETHASIRASTKTSASFENAQVNARHYRRLKTKCKPRWNAMYEMLDSHQTSEQEIRAVARKHPDRVREIIFFTSLCYLSPPQLTLALNSYDLQVGEATISQSFLNKLRKHTPYLKEMKECHADLQKKGALLHEGQDALDTLMECVEEGVGGFEHCKLKDTHIKIGNKHDKGKFNCVLTLSFLNHSASCLPMPHSTKQIALS